MELITITCPQCKKKEDYEFFKMNSWVNVLPISQKVEERPTMRKNGLWEFECQNCGYKFVANVDSGVAKYVR